MIIPNNLIKLEYDPTKDILFVEWPDFEYYSLPEIHQILENLVDTIRHYDINYLLVDARTTVVAIKDDDYEQIALKFAENLMTTRLKKLARLTSGNITREKQVEDVKSKSRLTLEIGNFETVDEALNWFST